jgi:PDZ domain-containing secreted protein
VPFKKRKIVVFLVVLGLLFLGFFIRTDYVLVKPGSAQDLREIVNVEGADQDDVGKFFW